MKKIEAIIRPKMFNAVRDALATLGIMGLNTSDITGYGRQKGHNAIYRGVQYYVDAHDYLKLEVVVPEGLIDDALEAIQKTARTGQLGDGKIFVSDLQQVISIRTGEEDNSAV